MTEIEQQARIAKLEAGELHTAIDVLTRGGCTRTEAVEYLMWNGLNVRVLKRLDDALRGTWNALADIEAALGVRDANMK